MKIMYKKEDINALTISSFPISTTLHDLICENENLNTGLVT